MTVSAGTAAVPVSGQDFQFDLDRPDARAPAGVLFDHLIAPGQFQIGYDFRSTDLDGLASGTAPTLFEEVLALFPIAPANMEALYHQLSLTYGLSDNLSVVGVLPFVQSRMGHLTRSGEAFFTESSGLGDARLGGLYRLYASGAIRAHIEGAVSVPSGSITQEDVTPASAPRPDQLPYIMQAGSGTFDLYPGMTVQVMNEVGTVGAQIRGTFHLGENDRGYRLGDRVMASAWMAPRINDFLSLSGRVVISNWDGITGVDADLDPSEVPTAESSFTGGMTVEIPFGLNVVMVDGPLQGHRLAFEASFPVHQDYDGIQLERSWTLLVSWEKAF